eukprot:scpid94476/ scgid5645/ 
MAHTERRGQRQSVLTSIKPFPPDQQLLLVEVAGDGGVSTWLGTQSMVLTPSSIINNNDFRDALCLRYGLAMDSVPSSCASGRVPVAVRRSANMPNGSTMLIAARSRHWCLPQTACADATISLRTLPACADATISLRTLPACADATISLRTLPARIHDRNRES